MNPDLLCPDIVQILAWAIHHPDTVGPALAAIGDPEVLFSDEATVTALGGLLARADVETVCRAVRCPETARRVRWMAAMGTADAARRVRLKEPPEPAPTPDEVTACVARALRWQADAVEHAADAVEAGASVSSAVAMGALVRRREDLEGAR